MLFMTCNSDYITLYQNESGVRLATRPLFPREDGRRPSRVEPGYETSRNICDVRTSRLPDHIFHLCGRAKLNQNPGCQELQIKLKKVYGPKIAWKRSDSEHQI